MSLSAAAGFILAAFVAGLVIGGLIVRSIFKRQIRALTGFSHALERGMHYRPRQD